MHCNLVSNVLEPNLMAASLAVTHSILMVAPAELYKGANDSLNSVFLRFSSVPQSCLTLCDSMDCSTPGLPVHCQLPEFTQTHVHWVSDAIQPSHPLLSPSPLALNLSQHQGLFKWVSSLHQVAKVLEFQLQHQTFQWIPWESVCSQSPLRSQVRGEKGDV